MGIWSTKRDHRRSRTDGYHVLALGQLTSRANPKGPLWPSCRTGRPFANPLALGLLLARLARWGGSDCSTPRPTVAPWRSGQRRVQQASPIVKGATVAPLTK